ncbi:hypothetical protein Rhopal_001451-T1 [Rhodotorula paludigena]|uniref:Metallothionein n=1 Tax=Rhodotorula paludigena TaxID=86838 RepID=A0AAV5GFV7_9BASI|nr:hypothetical protein Rhopal_001451-T1 [Rhodotorula paludigena]
MTTCNCSSVGSCNLFDAHILPWALAKARGTLKCPPNTCACAKCDGGKAKREACDCVAKDSEGTETCACSSKEDCKCGSSCTCKSCGHNSGKL